MNDIPLKQIIDSALGKIGSVADVNTVVGEPITINDGITVIPFSKVSVGVASGGADYDGKKPESENVHFAGGNGIGVSVTPLGFIIINGSDVRVVDLKNPIVTVTPNDNISRIIDALSTILDKAPALIDKLKDKKKSDSEKE